MVVRGKPRIQAGDPKFLACSLHPGPRPPPQWFKYPTEEVSYFCTSPSLLSHPHNSIFNRESSSNGCKHRPIIVSRHHGGFGQISMLRNRWRAWEVYRYGCVGGSSERGRNSEVVGVKWRLDHRSTKYSSGTEHPQLHDKFPDQILLPFHLISGELPPPFQSARHFRLPNNNFYDLRIPFEDLQILATGVSRDA